MKTFNVTSGKICITDPCYGKGTWCGNYDLPAKNGEWAVEVLMSNCGSWGNRVAELQCWHVEAGKIDNGKWLRLKNEVGVDSGQAGVF